MITTQVYSGSSPPCISEETVKFALDALCDSGHPRQTNPLETLLLIDDALLNTSLPYGPSNRSYLLAWLLTSLISDEWYRCRRLMGLTAPLHEIPLEQAQKAIKEEAKFANPELLGWSWLYYHYVRPELNISAASFSQLACIDQRTLLRYRQHAVRRLMFHLIEREETARKKRQKRQLHAQLPKMSLIPLFGRETEFHWLESRLYCGQPIAMQIIGTQGIGKTVFVQKAVHELIETNSIEFLFWFDKPTSVRAIGQHLTIFIQEQGLFVSVREFAQRCKIAVIIDGIDTLSDELETLEELLDDLECAMVFLTSYVPVSLRNTSGHIVLAELERCDAEQFIRVLISNWHYRYFEHLNDGDLGAIWEQARGNPRLIEKAVWKLQAQRVSEDNSGKLLTVFR